MALNSPCIECRYFHSNCFIQSLKGYLGVLGVLVMENRFTYNSNSLFQLRFLQSGSLMCRMVYNHCYNQGSSSPHTADGDKEKRFDFSC